MTYVDPDSESTLELNTIALFKSLAWESANCYHETFGEFSTLGREKHRNKLYWNSDCDRPSRNSTRGSMRWHWTWR